MSSDKKVLILDSSQIDTFLTCPTQWDYNYGQSLVTIKQSETLDSPMVMGTYGHKLLEIYYKCLAEGEGKQNAIGAAEAFNPDEETCSICQRDKDADIHDFTTEIANNPIHAECHPFKGEPFPLDKPSRALVLKRFREYTWTYMSNDFTPITSESVEMGFSHKLYEDDNYLFILEGRIDGLGTITGNKIWWDHKFQMRKRDLYKKSIQFRNYSLVVDLPLGIINYIRLTKEVTSDTYKRDVVTFSSEERDWWRDELISIFRQISDQLYVMNYYGQSPERNYSSCSGKFGYPCNYTQLCEERNLIVRENLKNQFFTKRQEWKPW